jgi:hypothetical protein
MSIKKKEKRKRKKEARLVNRECGIKQRHEN